MTPRKFDLETALQFLADEYEEYPIRYTDSDQWKFRSSNNVSNSPWITSSVIHGPGHTSLTEATMARIRQHRMELRQTLQAVQDQGDRTMQSLARITSLGNIGKDESDG